MNLKTKLFLIGMLLCNISLFAQDKYMLSGTVLDQNNVPVPGVNVIVANTSRGTATDFDGNYQLEVSKGEKLKFSFLGYISQTIAINGQKKLNVSLAEDASQLDEVVVVGYGARRKSDITGAVSSVKYEELNAFPVLDATQALQGRAAGVVVQSNNGGEPGAPISIKIRGNTSINASSEPLIVVDGFVGATMPQATDIESMEILKDASATAIYGSRGSNGVVLVTTKKGRIGKLSVELNSNYSVQNTANRLDLLNGPEFVAFQQSFFPGYVGGTENTDWQDLLYRTGSTANHQFSFSGGSEKINFYASTNYFKQDGIVINSDFERVTFLSNVDAQVTDKLKLGMNLFGSVGNKSGIATQSSGATANGGGDDVISLMFRFTPDRGVFDSNGVVTQNSVGENVDNPFAVATQRVDDTTTDEYRANLYANYDILENLSFKTTFGYSTLNSNRGTLVPSTLTANDRGLGGTANITNRRSTTLLSENYLTYSQEIGKGDLTVLAGYSYQKNTTFRFAAGATGLIDQDFSFYNLAGSAQTLIPTSSLVEQEIVSHFGRLNYDYDDKYLLTATVRRDGSSNFAKNEKFAIFPSGAIGWKISNEDFLKDNEHISNLKLRASYGLTGNQAINAYQSLARFNTVNGLYAGGIVSAVVPDQASNDDLKWETSYQTNIGLDVGLLNNKVSLSLDYYNIDTKDLIIADTSQPLYLGFLNPASLRNVGEVNNKGFEITLNTRNITNENFRWTTDFNWSTNKNKVVTLLNGQDIFLDASPSYFSRRDTHILREGETPGVFYGFESRGVWQGGTLPGGTATLPGAVVGDPLYTDVDGGGVINDLDRKIIGDPNPDFTFGITNNFTYKNFDLNIFFQGSQGGDIFNLTNVQLYNGDGNASRDVLNAWTTTNTNTNIPRIANRRDLSSRFVEDGSYIRLKNIALGYNLPSDITEKLKMDNVRFTVSAQNLFTITNYSGLDPEASYFADSAGSSSAANTTSGFDFGNYPTVRSVNFSLNVKF